MQNLSSEKQLITLCTDAGFVKTEGGIQVSHPKFCTNYIDTQILHLRAIKGHSGENPVDPSLLDNVLIPKDCFPFIHHIVSYFNMRKQKLWKRSAKGILHSRRSHEQELVRAGRTGPDKAQTCCLQTSVEN